MNNAKEIAEKTIEALVPEAPIYILARAYLELNEKYDKVLSYTSKSLDIDTAFTIVSMNDEITKLKKSRDVLRKAVEFYGDLQNHRMIHDSGDGFVNMSNIDLDVGRKASEAIKEDDEIFADKV